MKILNFGSLNIDYVYSVDHFVRPGETLSSNSLNEFCGGKGLNQSIAIARAGSPVFHAGKIGKEGSMLKKALRDSGVDVSSIPECDTATGHAIIQVDKNGQNCILLHSGANFQIDQDFIDSILSNFEKDDVILLQNEISNIPYIMQKAYEKGMRIAFNPSPINPQLHDYPLKYVKWFILNEIEGKEITNKENPTEIADSLIRMFPGCAVVLTLGRKGVLYKDANQSATHGVYKLKPVDTTAAGDTFTGYFISGIVEGLEIDEILRRASIASSLAVSRTGASTSIPLKEEVLNAKLELE